MRTFKWQIIFALSLVAFMACQPSQSPTSTSQQETPLASKSPVRTMTETPQSSPVQATAPSTTPKIITSTPSPPTATLTPTVPLNPIFRTATELDLPTATQIPTRTPTQHATPVILPSRTLSGIDLIDTDPTQETAACRGVIIAWLGVNIRASNSDKSEIIGSLRLGEQVNYQKHITTDFNGGYAWVLLSDGGWIAAKFIDPPC